MDLIERQDAIDAFAAECEGPYEACIQVAVELFRDIPSARKMGKWEKIPKQEHLVKCSVCGSTSIENSYKFCPHCGSEMEIE